MIDNSTRVQQWLHSSLSSRDTLWAVLARTNGATGLKAWYELDGSATPVGLYRGTQYEQWHAVQPLLVKVGRYSPFLQWVEKTDSLSWGWLAVSPLNEKTITDHLRALTQIFLPDGNTAFFRYWDGRFLLTHISWSLKEWQKVLPVFSSYWINGVTVNTVVNTDIPVRHSPWWKVPEGLIDYLNNEHSPAAVANVVQWLKETHPSLYTQYSPPQITHKIALLYDHVQSLSLSKQDQSALLKKTLLADLSPLTHG